MAMQFFNEKLIQKLKIMLLWRVLQKFNIKCMIKKRKNIFQKITLLILFLNEINQNINFFYED